MQRVALLVYSLTHSATWLTHALWAQWAAVLPFFGWILCWHILQTQFPSFNVLLSAPLLDMTACWWGVYDASLKITLSHSTDTEVGKWMGDPFTFLQASLFSHSKLDCWSIPWHLERFHLIRYFACSWMCHTHVDCWTKPTFVWVSGES